MVVVTMLFWSVVTTAVKRGCDKLPIQVTLMRHSKRSLETKLG